MEDNDDSGDEAEDGTDEDELLGGRGPIGGMDPSENVQVAIFKQQSAIESVLLWERLTVTKAEFNY